MSAMVILCGRCSREANVLNSFSATTLTTGFSMSSAFVVERSSLARMRRSDLRLCSLGPYLFIHLFIYCARSSKTSTSKHTKPNTLPQYATPGLTTHSSLTTLETKTVTSRTEGPKLTLVALG